MADVKISALPTATTPLAGTEVLPIVQSATTKQVAVSDLTAGRGISASSLTLTTPLSAANGGTGVSSYITGDLLYASSSSALSVLADVATGNSLISGGVGVAPSWGKIGLTTHVSGTLPVANGGTGITALGTGVATALGNATNAASGLVALDANQNASIGGTLAMGSSFLRNRIINGDMRIDQRNAGASVTPTASTYTLDRWSARLTQASKYSVQQSTTVPNNTFTNSILATSLSAYSVLSTDSFGLQQVIEGFNTSDLAWGTSDAKAITLSFWARSSIAGTNTYAGTLRNDNGDRSYVFTYTLAANTWTYVTITVPGPTDGTWLTNNGGGIYLTFSLGTGSNYYTTAGSWQNGNYLSTSGATSVVGTNGATFYITGVQLEVGSVATPFERRQYGQELALCLRYYEKSPTLFAFYPSLNNTFNSSGNGGAIWNFTTIKRATPVTITAGTPTNATLASTDTATVYGTRFVLSPTSAGSQAQITSCSADAEL